MAAAVHDLLEALSSAGVTIEARVDSLRYRPRSALTPELLAAVQSCKEDLLKILQNCSPSHKGLGTVGSPLPPNTAPGTQASSIATLAQTPADGESRADIEFARFEKIARPMVDGSGWFDPTAEPVPASVSGEQWDQFLTDCRNLGKAVRA